MAISMVEAVERIKRAGSTNVRAVPMPGQSATGGMYKVEIMEGGGWVSVAEGLPQTTAQDLIRQAGNRTICG